MSTNGNASTAINTIEQTSNKIIIAWADGHQSAFHYIWLRDNCSCEPCGDHSGGHRFLELGDIPAAITPQAVQTDGNGGLEITWENDGHKTHYQTDWLRAHCYTSPSERANRRHQPILWDKSIAGNVPEADYIKAQTDEAERWHIHESVRTYGLCLLRNVPSEVAETERLAELLGYVRETHYGRVFEIITTPDPAVLANSPHPIRPHTDENFREPPPGIMVFHCLQASEDGGGVSVMTDGFKIAADLKAADPEAYEFLSRVPIPHRRFLDTVGLRAEAPVIGLDYFGQIKEFRLNDRTMGPIDLPPELMEPAYAALRQVFDMVYDPQYHLHHLLNSGEAFAFDNARVMHARTGFNGNRHVRLTHIGSDEFYSRWRVLSRKVNGSINRI
ncbi:MAG: TauD/TfdA family dioxygenase [Chloroflexota bacterium]